MISKINYNGNLYVVGEPIALSDTVDGIIYVPLDDVEAWKELNQDKNIVGYNYNVKRVTQDEFLPTEVTAESAESGIINIFEGQKLNRIVISKKIWKGHNGNMLSFPFDISVKELKEALAPVEIYGIYYSTGFESHVTFKEDHTINNGTFALLNDESITDSTIIKAGTPFGFTIDEEGSVVQATDHLEFKNKTIHLLNMVQKPCKSDGWYLVGSMVKQHPNTGLATCPQMLAVGNNGGFSKGNIQTANIAAFSAWLEYRGEFE